MKARIVTGAERAQREARRSTERARQRVFAGGEQPGTVHERGAAIVRSVMEARRLTWWRRALMRLREWWERVGP